jgi:hypothetical protein
MMATKVGIRVARGQMVTIETHSIKSDPQQASLRGNIRLKRKSGVKMPPK